MSQESVEIVRQGLATLLRTGNPPLDGYDPDLVLDISASISPERGVYRGYESVRSLIAHYAEAWEELVFEADQFIDAGEDCVIVALRARAKGRGSGIEVGAQAAYAVTLRDGRVIRLQLYQSLAEALEAFGLE